MITQLEHAALSVANLDRSLAFYRDILGFQLIRIIEPRADAMLGTIVGLPGAQARIAHLGFGDNMIELFEYVVPRGKPAPKERTQADHGFSHIGFRSDDVRADYRKLKGQGVEFLDEPVEFRPGVWVVYFRGPDGEVGELRQT
jgi:catechol 2,3-dioxygenase-like lactoylglutathione lyase family enzyme